MPDQLCCSMLTKEAVLHAAVDDEPSLALPLVQVATVQQPTPEACCRACRAWNSSAGSRAGGNSPSPLNATPSVCNVWSHCSNPDGCRFTTDDGAELALPEGGCELRFQELVQPMLGFPAALIAKGPNVPFSAGGPIVTSAPQVGASW